MILTPLLAMSLGATTLTLDFTKPGVPVSPMLYGLMTEEINYSYEGGLYGELVRNRAFGDHPSLAHWEKLDDSSEVAYASEEGRPRIGVRGGIVNRGYWGIPIRAGARYQARLSLVAPKGVQPATLSLESNDGSTVYASAPLKAETREWQDLSVELIVRKNLPAPITGRLAIRTSRDQETSFRYVSLFTETYNDRPNGNRKDLMDLLVAMKPKFLRFPGGNYLEGNSLAERFDWKSTIGPVSQRRGHRSPWGYLSTDGLGLLEFLEWTEDMNAKPVLAVFAGYTLNGKHIAPGKELEPYVSDALDEIEYVIGDATTKWGSQRVKDGHAAPFDLQYVEIGNEDGFDRSGSYPARFDQFCKAIRERYPNLKVISTTGGKDFLGARYKDFSVAPDLVDEHYYASDWDMMAMATKYDSYDRQGPKIFVGEWAAQGVGNPWGRPGSSSPTPNMGSAIADAAFMTGMERNSDIVLMSCYAPLLVNVNPGGRQWPVNLIGYDALKSFGSPSYYAQKLFSNHVGDQTVPIEISNAPEQTNGKSKLPGLFSSVTVKKKSKEVAIKLVNPMHEFQVVSVVVKGQRLGSEAKMITISGVPSATNNISASQRVSPYETRLAILPHSFKVTLPPDSVSVLLARKQ